MHKISSNVVFSTSALCCCILITSLCVGHSHQDSSQSGVDSSGQFFGRFQRHDHADDLTDDHGNETEVECGPEEQSRLDSHGHSHCVANNRISDYKVWLSSTGAVLIISLCGIFGVMVVPIMEQIFYQHLIQFLIALAVGTLSGDALLHLLPHSIIIGQTQISSEAAHAIAVSAMWKGCFALGALVFFFLMERVINMVGEWKESKNHARREKKKIKIVRSGHKTSDKAVGHTLCKHKYSPYCIADFDLEKIPPGGSKDNNTLDQTAITETLVEEKEVMITSCCSDEDNPCNNQHIISEELIGDGKNGNANGSSHSLKSFTKNSSVTGTVSKSSIDEYDTVFVRDHEHLHHGHSHAHSHLHSAPKSITSVAWMVIFGDGIHNLADGLAIGAAFVQDPLTGIATSIAILCHELPHEIGDFAMLLKTGMSLKQAVFYNIVSSVLSFIGMVIGVLLGNVGDLGGWIFAATAGIFLYVALVDMIPELNSGHSHPFSNSTQKESHHLELALQVSGICIGIGIMLVIAVFEEDLKGALSN